MNSCWFRKLIWLMWLALPATALRFWSAWGQLPVRMATHFNASGQPNGWMPKETALVFALGITAVMLIVFTAILWIMQKQEVTGAASWAMLAFSYLIIAFVYSANDKVVSYNLTGQRVDLDLWMALLPPAIIVFLAIYLQSKRGQALPASVPLAEETHSSRRWGAVLMLAGSGILVGGMQAPAAALKIGIALISALLLVSGLAAWSGFRYSFSPSGLEISTLGYRLRSIPKEQIKSYAIAPWNIARGYGIRGVGNSRAYVWGNRGVQIETTQGQVFIGHNHPERIVRDLEMIAPRGAPVASR